MVKSVCAVQLDFSMTTRVALEAFGPTQPNQLFLPGFLGTKFFLKLQSLLGTANVLAPAFKLTSNTLEEN
jgi:hypothetical protein